MILETDAEVTCNENKNSLPHSCACLFFVCEHAHADVNAITIGGYAS